MVTLTPSSVRYGEGSYSEPGISATRGYGNKQEPLLVISNQEDSMLGGLSRQLSRTQKDDEKCTDSF